jgi:hypothetical protein
LVIYDFNNLFTTLIARNIYSALCDVAASLCTFPISLRFGFGEGDCVLLRPSPFALGCLVRVSSTTPDRHLPVSEIPAPEDQPSPPVLQSAILLYLS